MNLLKKFTINSLKLNKKRTIVTIIGIMLSVALITSVTALYLSGMASITDLQKVQEGDYHHAFYNVPASEIASFENNKDIEKNYITQSIGYAYFYESKSEWKPYLHVKALTEDSLSNLGLNLIEGRFPKKENEIVITNQLKTESNIEYEIGDTITIEVGKRVSNGKELLQDEPYNEEIPEEIVNTTLKEFKIVGIITQPCEGIESYFSPAFTLITYLNENNISGTVDIYSRFTSKGIEEDYRVVADIIGIDSELMRRYLNRDGYQIRTEEESNLIIESLANAKYQTFPNETLIILERGVFKTPMGQMLISAIFFVCLIIVGTSVICITNSIEISITEKTKQYGMLSSIGATKKQIKKNVYYEAFILGTIAIPLGILLGFILSFLLIFITNIVLKSLFDISIITYSFSPSAILFAAVLGIIIVFLSSANSARRASKITPISAIRSNKDVKIKSKELKIPKFIKKIFGIGGEIAYKNLKRNKKKYNSTVIAIVICVSIFIGLYSFVTLLYDFTDFSTPTAYNIDISYDQNFDEKTKKFREIVKLNGIKEYSIYYTDTFQIKNPNYTKEYSKENPEKLNPTMYDDNGNIVEAEPFEAIDIHILEESTYLNYINDLGLTYEEAKDKIIVINNLTYYKKTTSKKSEELVEGPIFNMNKQDSFTFDIINDEETITKTFDVIEETSKQPFGIDKPHYFTIGIVNEEFYLQNFQKELLFERILIDSEDPYELQEAIEKKLSGEDYILINIEETNRMLKAILTLVACFLYGFIIIIALIGITNIFNTITTSMELRKQEFAILKSIGMTTQEFNRMIRLESFFYGTKSLLIGISIGCLLSYAVYRGTENTIPFKFPLIAVIICILVVFILISCIMKYSINKINKQNTIETIRNENI